MSFIATHLSTIPGSGFKWYLIFLEGPFKDEIQKEIGAYFFDLGRETGKDALVIRGFDPTHFRESVFEAPAFFDDKWHQRAKFPALIVTNCSPSDALAKPENLDNGKVMIFPLGELYQEHKSISGFLGQLVEALKQEDALKALETLDGSKLKKGWGWLSEYFKMEPGFFGFNVKLDKVIKDLIAKHSNG